MRRKTALRDKFWSPIRLIRLPAAIAPSLNPEVPLPLAKEPSGVAFANGMGDFERLQQRMLLATLVVAALAVPTAAFAFGWDVALSLLIGAFAGLVYLWLLSRSVARLGEASRSLSKVQLLVPVVLVLAGTRLPQLQLLPALVGFLLYKPALLVQAALDR
jgi:ATP synthase protein I